MSEDQGPEVYKVIGAPGTGKTTRVVGNPELDIKGLFLENMPEYPLDQQMLVTYTNSGVDEASNRLKRMLDSPKTHIDERVTTIHSRCYQLLNHHPRFDGLEREQVVQHWNKKKFCDIHELEYSWDSEDKDDIMGKDMAEGNAIFQIYGWLQSNRKPLEEWDDCPVGWNGTDDPLFLMQEWENYKEDNRLVGFGDMIIETIRLGRQQLENLGWEPLFENDVSDREFFKDSIDHPRYDPNIIRGKGAFIDTKVLYVDECQDLTRLQWDWYLLQKLVCEKTFLGFDDDQTIYGWSGADPSQPLHEEGEFEVLDRTYRIPENIWSICDGVIRQVEERQEKEVTPDGDGGEVIQLRRPSPNRIIRELEEEDDVFMLFRANYMIDEFTNEALIPNGIPYRNQSTFDIWDGDVHEIVKGIGRMLEGNDRIKHSEAEALINNLDEDHVDKNGERSGRDAAIDKFRGYKIDDLNNVIKIRGLKLGERFKVDRYLEYAEELNYYQKEAIKGAILNENWDMDPSRITLGTIHSSKGMEAETVVLALDSTQTILEEMRQKTEGEDKFVSDDERRVYYVGMTRASEKLVLCQGMVDPDMTIAISGLLAPEDMDIDSEQTTMAESASW